MSTTKSMIEMLETRRLLTAAVDGARNLIVDGTSGADGITVTLSGSDIRVKIINQSYNKSFPPADFDTIVITGGDGNDVVTIAQNVTKPTDTRGNGGNDLLIGGGGDDSLDGGSGDDTLSGGAGHDLLFGNTGNDTADYTTRTDDLSITLDNLDNDGAPGEIDNVDQSCDTILCGTGDDLVVNSLNINNRAFFGREGNDTLLGGTAGDRLNGGKGDDSLNGGDGPDVLISTGGRDTMIGGNGDDIVTYYHTTRAVKITLDGLANDGTAGENANVASDVEVLIGGSGNDTLVGNDNNESLLGGSGNDSLLGNGGRDRLFGSGGADFLDGGAGNDSLHGGTGNDTLVGGAHRDEFFGDEGNDLMIANDGKADTLDGGLGDNTNTHDVLDVLVA